MTLGRATTGRHPEDFAPRVGFLFQSPERQLFAASVRGECSLAPRLAGWDPDRIAAGVAATLAELGLTDTAEQHPYDLPLPRRRLVALAAVLAVDPDLLLLDEPTAALDCASRNRVIHVIRERVRRGRTVLAITHDPILAHEALDRGVVLGRGRVVDDGTIRAVIDGRWMARPAALTVAVALGLGPGTDRRDDVARRCARAEAEVPRCRYHRQHSLQRRSISCVLDRRSGGHCADTRASRATFDPVGVPDHRRGRRPRVGDLRLPAAAPGVSILRDALTEHHTARLRLPAGLSAAHWRAIAELYASPRGLYGSIDEVRDALRFSVPDVMVSATGGMTGEADLREALFEMPGLRSATSASANEHAGDQEAAELADLTEHLDPLLRAAASARDNRDYPKLAQALVQIHQLEDGGNDTHRAIVARERRRVVPSESLLSMARLVPKPETPAVISRALSLLGTDGAAALIVMLSGAPPAPERRAYIDVLVDCHDCDDAIIAALGSTRSELVRDAAEVVGRKRLERAVPTLTNLLKRPQVEIRTAAWHALENIGTRDALKALHAHA